MKNKISAILVMLFLGLIPTLTNAQTLTKPFSLGLYGETGFPTGDFALAHNTGFGFGMQTDIKLPLIGLGITGSAGYINFPGKSGVKELAAIPIRAGIKYSITALYFKLEGGVAKTLNSDNSKTPFIISPGVGFKLGKLDIQGKYEIWTADQSQAFWGIKLGFNIL